MFDDDARRYEAVRYPEDPDVIRPPRDHPGPAGTRYGPEGRPA